MNNERLAPADVYLREILGDSLVGGTMTVVTQRYNKGWRAMGTGTCR
jgi:hypothetical protein